MNKVGLIASLILAIVPHSASAIVWPDFAERVERDMSAADPATRRAAAHELIALGPIRGGPLAIAALSDPDDDVRMAAADAAIRLRAVGATETVLTWLNAPDVRLRRKACEVARALPGARAVGPLARSLGDPDPEVRAAASEALGHQLSADAVPPLLGRMDDPAPAVRMQIVAALARLGDARAVVPLLGKVQDSSPDVRQAVARALGDLGDVRASSALVLGLRDQNEDVRRETLNALGRMRAADAVDAIVPFVSDRTPSLRTAAFAALGHIASPEGVRVLIGALGANDDAAASLERSAARDALVSASAAAIPQLHALLTAPASPAEAVGAAWVLGALHAHTEARTIVAALRRGALQPAAALHALIGAGNASEVPVVLEFVADPSPIVRREALAAAAALLDPGHPDGRAVEPLAGVLRDVHPSPEERIRIAALLGRTGAPRAASLLTDFVHAPEASLRIAAIDALGVLGPSGADDVLLDAIGSTDTTVRLHAAIALSEAGGPRARQALMAKLDGGDEWDRALLLTSLGGILSREPSESAVERLVATLEPASGPDRDAIIEAFGRAPLASSGQALAALASAPEPADRQAVAVLLAAHSGDKTAIAAASALLGDKDPSVRAQAAWSLGSIGTVADIEQLEGLVQGADVDPAVDAAAAIGRIAARSHNSDISSHWLCAHISDPRPYVRTNALAGLALARGRCGDGSGERRELAIDANEDVRAAAALVMWRAGSADDRRALERCARTDTSGAVAARCRKHSESRGSTHAVLVFVVPEGATTPRPHGAYAMLLADGTIHAGTTDRRGATFDPAAPEGEAALRPPSTLR